MRRSQRAPGRIQRVLLPPESSEESEDDLDADPTYNPDEQQTCRLEQFLTANRRRDHDSPSDEETDEEGSEEAEEEEGNPNDHPDSDAAQQPSSSKRKKKNEPPPPIWTTVSADDSFRDIPIWQETEPEPNEVNCPIDYFRNFFDRNLVQNIVDQSNLYAVQTNPNKPLNLSLNELDQFLGVCIGMSIYNLPRTRMYWASTTRIDRIANVMSRDRWEQIKSFLHFNDNSNLIRNDPNRDRLFKIRPLLDHFKAKFREIPKEQYLCVDEQIVPYKGKTSLKQYNPKKPKKWGYKIFVLCDSTGLVYDFEVYVGKILPVPGLPDIGASSNVVLRMSESIPRGKNYLLFFDNWFASLPLFFVLKSLGIESLGTARTNRFPGLNFTNDKDMKQNFGRGSVEEKRHVKEGSGEEVRAIKWMDNRGVVIVSTFESAFPLTTVTRYDKPQSSNIDVTCPKAVITYNKFMGGVDLLDGLVAYYRIKIRSRKYYMRLVYHFVDMAVVNGWLLYRRDCKRQGWQKKEIIDLLQFRSEIFGVLANEGKVMKRRGRPSADHEDAAYENRKKRGPATPIPVQQVRQDEIGHWPIVGDSRKRCKKSGCDAKTVFRCSKCNVPLCITKERNCFSSSFHGL